MLFRRRRKKYKNHELAPDEIFLDSSNLPEFNQGSLEGRLEKPISRGSYLGIAGVMGLILFALVAQAANLGIMQGTKYALQSERNRLRPEVIFAKRGAIMDRNGTHLVSNNEEPQEGGGMQIRRTYEAPGFAHLLGYVSYPKKDSSGNYYDTDITGLAGVEAAFNDRLAGENGTLLIEENAKGDLQSQGSVTPVKNGDAVTLSIDARAQRAFYDAIKERADASGFQGGAAVLMDVETGEVHALVSYPEYDPNILSKGTPADVIEGYANDHRQVYLDRAISGLYTPGSIVKPAEAAGAISDGVIFPEKSIYSAGSISIPNPYDASKPSIFKDWKAHGWVDARRAIAVSSDIYFYAVGGGYQDQRGLGIERLGYWFRAFGLTSKTGIELGNEAAGIMPSPAWKEENFGDPWRLGDTYNTSIGQYGMQITMMEIARAYAAIANGGRLVRPTLRFGQSTASEKIEISPYALQVAREGMRDGVIGGGTSQGLGDLSFARLAGKTGTAQLGVNNEFYNMWAVGFWPYEHPKYVYVVLMDRGPAGTTVGSIAATHKALSGLHEAAPEYFE
ncbi:MAG: penicillin-binding protein 2 [Candidatus Parcubacteria bacterium]|jgi:penicillin-binding protein 2|nr:penicillin-binding protein 2 [Candidatus Parcubacteria bacterium]